MLRNNVKLSTGKPSSYYSTLYSDEKNPVLQKLNNDLIQFKRIIKNQNTSSINYECGTESKYSHLFNLWNAYEWKLPKLLYEGKLLEIGEFLCLNGEYQLAGWHCYGRYLRAITEVNVEEISSEEEFSETFFKDGFDTENAVYTFRALMGRALCSYRDLESRDPKLQNEDSVRQCQDVLKFLRLIIQVIGQKEKLCWLVYNGTINIYVICRHLMQFGYSKMVLEYLLWACSCMEFHIPLLTVKYLPWRATLYTTACKAFYDSNLTEDAERFGRRALAKISELNQLELMSNQLPSIEVENAFREATIKVSIMVFKRSVFESRRRPKGQLRPKNKVNFKEALMQDSTLLTSPWPRTQTEKYLHEMMDGSAAQMYCILEALSNTNRRLLKHGSPVTESESELLDVYTELFLAAQEIIVGGGGNTARNSRVHHIPGSGNSTMGGLVTEAGCLHAGKTMLQLSVAGIDGVTLDSIVQLLKLAFTFESWDTFDMFVDSVLLILDNSDSEWATIESKSLNLLQSLKHLHTVKKAQGRRVQMDQPAGNAKPKVSAAVPMVDNGEEGLGAVDGQNDSNTTVTNKKRLAPDDQMLNIAGGASHQRIGSAKSKMSDQMSTMPGHQHGPPPAQLQHKRQSSSSEPSQTKIKKSEIQMFAEALLSIVESNTPAAGYDLDMLMDAVLILWCKCKPIFQRLQTGSKENSKYLQKIKNANQWIFILDVIHRSLGWIRGGSVDPAMSAEVAIRLALVLETAASSRTNHEDNKSDSYSVAESCSESSSYVNILQKSASEQLSLAKSILEDGLKYVNGGRETVATSDGSSVVDVIWAQELNPSLFAPQDKAVWQNVNEEESNVMKQPASGTSNVWSTVKDIQLELWVMYHRVSLKLSNFRECQVMTKDELKKSKTDSKLKSVSTENDTGYNSLLKCCKRNRISKSLLLSERAISLYGLSSPPTSARQKEIQGLISDAENLLNKSMTEERVLYAEHCVERSMSTCALPPSPILLCRTDTFMIFKPAPWTPPNGEKVAWYRLYGRVVKGSNVKVRANDYNIKGTSREVPAFNCELRACELETNQQYMFAVAAFTSDGQMIGDSIGESTTPILASHPISILGALTYLARAAYKTRVFAAANNAFDLLWNHFVAKLPPPATDLIVTKSDNYKMNNFKLNLAIIQSSSPVLLRQFLTTLFISIDIATIEKRLFCDMLTSYGPPYKVQLDRLVECEKLLVGIDLAGWINEPNFALQSVIHAYGLLAPFIHLKMQTKPTVTVLQRCLAVLIEVPISLRQKRSPMISESLHRMTASITYYVSKSLATWNENRAAGHCNEIGRVLLNIASEQDNIKSKQSASQEDKDHIREVGEITSVDLIKKRKKPPGPQAGGAKKSKAESDSPLSANQNEELKDMENYLLSTMKQIISPYMFDAKYWKQGQGTSDHELTGNEDPTLLNAYVAFLPSRIAFKEVAKFSRRARYLEFYVQVLQKALSEGIVDQAIDWGRDINDWLDRRNESMMGALLLRTEAGRYQVNANMAAIGGKVEPKATNRSEGKNKAEGKHAAVVTEVSKKEEKEKKESEKEDEPTGGAGKKKKRKTKYKGIASMKLVDLEALRAMKLDPNMSDQYKQMQEDAEMMAVEVINLHLPEILKLGQKRRKFRQLVGEELPWRGQMNTVVGLSFFGRFVQKMELRNRLLDTGSKIYRNSYLDQEWFTLEESGTIIVSGESQRVGHPSSAAHSSIKSAANTRQNQGANPPLQESGRKMSKFQCGGKSKDKEAPSDMAANTQSGNKNSNHGALQSAALAVSGELMAGGPGDETPRTYRSDIQKKSHSPEVQAVSMESVADSLRDSFINLRRGVVLAHRGACWTLLQNNSRAIWNCANTAMTYVNADITSASSVSVVSTKNQISIDTLNKFMWKAFYIASDCLLDMLQDFIHTKRDRDLKHQKLVANSTREFEILNKCENSEEYWNPFEGPEAERGGCSLWFERFFDETDSFDINWIVKMVHRTIELLYNQEKYETLVHLAFRFNNITRNRHSAVILPIAIRAQGHLIDRVEEYGGCVVHKSAESGLQNLVQPHIQAALQALNKETIMSWEYHTLQLKVTRMEHQNWVALVKSREAAGQALARGVSATATNVEKLPEETMAYRLCSVPLNVKSTLEEFRTALSLTPHTSMALQHCRRLLLLYMIGQQNDSQPITSHAASRTRSAATTLEFQSTTGQPQTALVPDKSQEFFLHDSDVKSLALPTSQLNVVVDAYQKTIELLASRNQTGLVVQAMRELGSLFYHMQNRRAAYNVWVEALDMITGLAGTVKNYRSLCDNRDSQSDLQLTQALLNRCGLWGCLLGGVIASSIAQFIMTSDLGLKLEYCLLAGYCFKAVFRGSFPHPVSDRDYASYEIGEGCAVTNLIPGINLLGDKFRCDARSLENAVKYTIEELLRAGHSLFVLPLITLYLYIVGQMCRDLIRVVEGKILRLKVLTQMELFAEASGTLIDLLWGNRLPQPWDTNFRQAEGKMPTDVKLNSRKPLSSSENIKFMDCVLSKRLSTSLASLYGPNLTCRLSVAHANFLASLAKTIKALPSYPEPIAMHYLPSMSLSITEDDVRSVTSKSRKTTKVVIEDDYKSVMSNVNAYLQSQGKVLSDDIVKGCLCKTSRVILESMLDAIIESDDDEGSCINRSASEISLLVEIYLGLSILGQVCHHPRTGARYVQKAMILLSSAKIMKQNERMSEKESTQSTLKKNHDYYKTSKSPNYLEEMENFKSRGQLDFRLWLTCRYELAKCLQCELTGMGNVKGPHSDILIDTPDARTVCSTGMMEAEACGDIETKAKFLVILAELAKSEGESIQIIKCDLEEAVNLLSTVKHPSFSAISLKQEIRLILTDLSLISNDRDLSGLKSALNDYQKLHDEMLDMLEYMGEQVERQPNDPHLSTVLPPVANLFSSLLHTLVHCKLRMGHSMAILLADEMLKCGVADIKGLVHCLSVLTTGFLLSQCLVTRNPALDAEFLLIIGQVQRQLMQAGHIDLLTVSSTLIEGIKLVFTNHGDLGLIREFYLELSSTLLASTGYAVIQPDSSLKSLPRKPAEKSAAPVSPETKKPGSKAPAKSSSPTKPRNQLTKEQRQQLENSEEHRQRRAAWFAVRSAAQVGEAERSLISQLGSNSQMIEEEVKIPEFASYDLVSTYVLGEKQIISEGDIQEEVNLLMDDKPDHENRTYEDQIFDVQQATAGLSWSVLLRYHSLLSKICLNKGVNLKSDNLEETLDSSKLPNVSEETPASRPSTKDFLKSRLVVRTPLWSSYFMQRLVGLYNFLASEMTTFQTSCMAVIPNETYLLTSSGMELEETLNSIIESGLTDQTHHPVYYRSYRENYEDPLPQEANSNSLLAQQIASSAGVELNSKSSETKLPRPVPGSNSQLLDSDKLKTANKSISEMSETDLCFQIYCPSLDPSVVSPQSDKCFLFYASTQKLEKNQSWTSAIEIGMTDLSSVSILRLSTNLLSLVQMVDLMEESGDKADTPSGSQPGGSQAGKNAPPKRVGKQKAKPTVNTIKLDPKFELLLRQCLQELVEQLSQPGDERRELSFVSGSQDRSSDETPAVPEFPFEVTRDNLVDLKSVIDPEFGGIIKTSKVQTFLQELLMPDIIQS